MCESIKESCKLGVAAYAGQSREKWVLEWPGQVVLAVTAIFWTADVTNALKNGVPGGFACMLSNPHMLACLAAANLWCACILRVLLRSLVLLGLLYRWCEGSSRQVHWPAEQHCWVGAWSADQTAEEHPERTGSHGCACQRCDSQSGCSGH